jgi:hypothetical protein
VVHLYQQEIGNSLDSGDKRISNHDIKDLYWVEEGQNEGQAVDFTTFHMAGMFLAVYYNSRG